jgi:hypothetical protein
MVYGVFNMRAFDDFETEVQCEEIYTEDPQETLLQDWEVKAGFLTPYEADDSAEFERRVMGFVSISKDDLRDSNYEPKGS